VLITQVLIIRSSTFISRQKHVTKTNIPSNRVSDTEHQLAKNHRSESDPEDGSCTCTTANKITYKNERCFEVLRSFNLKDKIPLAFHTSHACVLCDKPRASSPTVNTALKCEPNRCNPSTAHFFLAFAKSPCRTQAEQECFPPAATEDPHGTSFPRIQYIQAFSSPVTARKLN
jgi:hypothetical protein